MENGASIARSIQRGLLAVLKFGPVVTADLSPWWVGEVAGNPDWAITRDLLLRVTERQFYLDADLAVSIIEHIGAILDLWDEDPTGSAYYPYKAAELIEMNLQVVTGKRSESSPVSLTEWVNRFAGRVDWQLKKSGIVLDPPQYFTTLEESLRERERLLAGADDEAFGLAKEAAIVAGGEYVRFLREALYG